MSTTIAAPAVSLVDVPSAAVALTQGKITKEQFIQFASSHAADSALVLRMMVDGVLSVAETSKIIDSQQAIAATPARQPGALHFKVSEKGAISVYGLQRMPVTLYGEQWKRLFAHREQIEAFAETNKAKLSTKSKS